EHLKALNEVSSLTVEQVMSNIYYFRCLSHVQLCASTMRDRGTASSPSSRPLLTRLAVSCRLAVLCTNQMTTRFGLTDAADSRVEPALGPSWCHVCNIRLVIERLEGGGGGGGCEDQRRRMRVLKHPAVRAGSSAVFQAGVFCFWTGGQVCAVGVRDAFQDDSAKIMSLEPTNSNCSFSGPSSSEVFQAGAGDTIAALTVASLCTAATCLLYLFDVMQLLANYRDRQQAIRSSICAFRELQILVDFVNTISNIIKIYLLLLQFVIAPPLVSFIITVVAIDSASLAVATKEMESVFVLVRTISTSLAFYGLILIFRVSRGPLSGQSITAKFGLMKLAILFGHIQILVFNILGAFSVINWIKCCLLGPRNGLSVSAGASSVQPGRRRPMSEYALIGESDSFPRTGSQTSVLFGQSIESSARANKPEVLRAREPSGCSDFVGSCCEAEKLKEFMSASQRRSLSASRWHAVPLVPLPVPVLQKLRSSGPSPQPSLQVSRGVAAAHLADDRVNRTAKMIVFRFYPVAGFLQHIDLGLSSAASAVEASAPSSGRESRDEGAEVSDMSAVKQNGGAEVFDVSLKGQNIWPWL
uniref:G_PROTEIN_RECEP_F1_2 domain-containing protein n=1 Tax=Macrostomum lignano TaxID=282301 RepID=A0A1I8JP61_9PLAT